MMVRVDGQRSTMEMTVMSLSIASNGTITINVHSYRKSHSSKYQFWWCTVMITKDNDDDDDDEDDDHWWWYDSLMEEQSKRELEKKLMLFRSQRCRIFHVWMYATMIFMLHATYVACCRSMEDDHGREQQDRARGRPHEIWHGGTGRRSAGRSVSLWLTNCCTWTNNGHYAWLTGLMYNSDPTIGSCKFS